MISIEVEPGPWRDSYLAALRRIRRMDAVGRVWDHDVSLFGQVPMEVLDRLGWLDHPDTMTSIVPDVERLVADADAEGIDRWYVVGMGGASLASEMMATLSFANARTRTVVVVDGTAPTT